MFREKFSLRNKALAVATALTVTAAGLAGSAAPVRSEIGAIESGCPIVITTRRAMVLYGMGTENGSYFPRGTVVRFMGDDESKTYGCFQVTDPGFIGLLFVQGSDVSPAGDFFPGFEEGEKIRAKISRDGGVESSVYMSPVMWFENQGLMGPENRVDFTVWRTSLPAVQR